MRNFIDTPGRALGAGVLLTLAVAVAWAVLAGMDRLGFISFLLRWLRIFTGIVWVGMIWFVNLIQFAAIDAADEPGRATLMRHVVPRVATTFRHMSHLNVLTGVLLLITAGYVLDITTFGVSVYVPPLRNLLLWGGTIGGLVMWGLVHFVIWPALKVTLGMSEGDATAARDRLRLGARINLALSIPVTFVMVAAAHLY